MAKPLDVRICCITEPYCDYPVAVKITMDDGTVRTYALENKMDLKFDHLMKRVQKSIEIGYQCKYKGKHEKSRCHRR